jgi:hypothetical protein
MANPLAFGRIFAGLMTLSLACMPLFGSLCKTCRGMAQTKDIGSCKLCSGMTTSGSFQLCMNCSDRLQACERCKTQLPAKPAAETVGIVLEMRMLAADRGKPPEEAWIRKALLAMGAPAGVGVISGWTTLGPEAITLHDSRHFGEAVLAWRDAGADAPLKVEITGSRMQTFDLPRLIGTQRVVKHTVSSSIASMDLFLAFRVVAASGTPTEPKP